MDLTSKILSDYTYYLKIERAMSPNTVVSYSTDVREFFEAVPSLPADVTTKEIIDYLAAKDKLSKRSQARLISSLACSLSSVSQTSQPTMSRLKRSMIIYR